MVVTPLVAFGWTPTTLLVTASVTVQLPLAGIVKPLRLNAVCPSVRLLPLAPTQVPPAFCAPLTAMSVSASVKLAPVRAIPFVFVKVKLIVDVPPLTIVAGLKAFTMVGLASALTVRSSAAVPPVNASPPPVPVTALVVFVTVPGVLLVTLTVTAQLAPAAKLATFRRTFPSPAVLAAPAVVVTVPQAAGVKPKVVSFRVTPPGKVSGSCTLVNAPGLPAGFVAVSVITLVPPTAILVGLKLFATVGGV